MPAWLHHQAQRLGQQPAAIARVHHGHQRLPVGAQRGARVAAAGAAAAALRGARRSHDDGAQTDSGGAKRAPPTHTRTRDAARARAHTHTHTHART
jgi:hypothetical protein